jgi:sterol desaturase/sphingolipid hydroxylase (fatty acid hydroxylase superfamily)
MILALILGSMLVVACCEFLRPRRRHQFSALRRRCANLGLWIANLLLGQFLISPVLNSSAAAHVAEGALRSPASAIAEAGVTSLVGFLLLDALQYATHRFEHAVPLFWRFHALHHSDPDVDVSTAVRHHPLEYVSASAAYWFGATMLGIPNYVVCGYGIGMFVAAAIQHGNIRLPEGVERWLRPVVMTTDLHLVHHLAAHDRKSANYGAVLSVWDRLFGTFVQLGRPGQEAIVFGVRGLSRSDCVKPSAMLLTPWLIAP